MRTSLPVWSLATGLDQPDDLVLADGEVYVGELGAAKIAVIAADGSVRRLPQTVPRPEGLAIWHLSLYVADQANDRVVGVPLGGGPVVTVIQLQPVAGKENLDGIGITSDGILVVPDSARGVVNWVETGGRIVKQEGGFVRPTGVWVERDGGILVADEYGNSVVRIAPDGARTVLVENLPIVDDVAEDGQGHVFVITPVVSGGRLAEIVSGQARDVVSGLLEPQGLAVDSAGNLIVSETSAGRVDLVIRNFKLVPVGAPAAPGQPICVHLVRAPGYSAPVSFESNGNVEVLRQPGTGDVGEVLLRGCSGGCQVMAGDGTSFDRLRITG